MNDERKNKQKGFVRKDINKNYIKGNKSWAILSFIVIVICQLITILKEKLELILSYFMD